MAETSAKTEAAPAETADPGGRRRFALAMGLSLLTAGLWQLAFAPFDQFYLGYVLLVPWAAGILMCRRFRAGLLVGSVVWVLAWAIGLYWLTWVTLGGYLALLVYLWLYAVVAVWMLRRSAAARLPLWAVMGAMVVALEYARAYGLSGFPWFFLAQSQYRQTMLIQIADATGQYGVSLLLAMTNGLVLEAIWRCVLKRPGPGRWSLPTGLAITLAMLAGMLLYGQYRLGQDTRSPGPTVGLVQCAFPISLFHDEPDRTEFFEVNYRLSAELVDRAELDLLVWPETVLPSFFEWDFRRIDPAGYNRPEIVQELKDRNLPLQRRLGELLAAEECRLLAGASVLRNDPRYPDEMSMFNSAVVFEPVAGGVRAVAMYDKMHPVPFSEYTPFRDSLPWLYRSLRSVVPTQMVQLVPGDGVVRMRTSDAPDAWRFATPICYEGVFARICRDLAYDRGRKRIDLLVNISNDGWFVYQGPAGHHASTELDQHLAMYVFRAIENRVPVVRSVNTGLSGFIDSNGRIEQLIGRDGQRKMVEAAGARQVLVDARHSVYSRVGDAVAQACSLAAMVLAVAAQRRARKRKNRGIGTE